MFKDKSHPAGNFCKYAQIAESDVKRIGFH